MLFFFNYKPRGVVRLVNKQNKKSNDATDWCFLLQQNVQTLKGQHQANSYNRWEQLFG